MTFQTGCTQYKLYDAPQGKKQKCQGVFFKDANEMRMLFIIRK